MTLNPDASGTNADRVANPHKVLVTGSAGTVGRAACAALREGGHQVRGFDLVPSPDLDDAVVGDITDPAALDRATTDMDTIIHLAAYPDEAPFLERLLQPNIVGVHEVLEAACRRDSVRRVVLASSVQVVSGLVAGWSDAGRRPLRIEDGMAPVNHYGATKAFAEHLGHVYSRRGLSVIVARIGWLPRTRRQVEQLAKHRYGPMHYTSPRDIGRFFRCAVEAVDVPYAVLFATGPGSSEGEALYDVTETKACIGYVPQDRFPEGLPFPWP